MKTTRFLFAILSFGALTFGPGFAGEPSPHVGARAPTKSSRPPVLNKSAAVVKDGTAAKKIERPRGKVVFSSVLRPSTTPPLNPAPRRGPGPASIGGPATSSAKNSATINGTGIRRKP
jgi:hypothetical protein